MQDSTQKRFAARSDDLIFFFLVVTFLVLPTGTAPPLVSVSLAGLVWLFSGRIFQIPKIAVQSWFWPVIPFILLPWVGLLYSQNSALGFDFADKTKYWIALFLTASLAHNGQRMDILVKSLWAGLLIGAFLAMLQLAGVIPLIKEDFLGFGVAHTLVSMYLLIGILMASFYFKQTEKISEKCLFLGLMAAFVFHLVFLEGRSGYLIFGLLSPLVANNLMAKVGARTRIILCVLLVSLMVLSPVVRDEIHYSMVKFKEQKAQILAGEYATDFPRVYIYGQAVKVLKDHPLTGIGTGSLPVLTKQSGHEVIHPHNNLLYMGTSFGVIGILVCLWLFWEMLKRSWQFRQGKTGYFVFSVTLVLFLGGLFDTQILNTCTLLLLTLTYGFLNHLKPAPDSD